MDVRVRLPELFERKDAPVRNAYQLAREVAKRSAVSKATAYRIVRARGRMQLLDTRLLDALCEIFGIGPEQLLEREPISRPPRKRPARKQPRAA